jgi:hypothetical protein
MGKSMRLCILAGVLTLMSAQARSQGGDTTADVRCVVAGIKYLGLPNSAQHSAGMMLVLYYLGRLDGHMPKLEVEDLIVKESARMAAADFDPEAKRCGDGITVRGQLIGQMGKEMIERAQKLGETSPAAK